MYIRVTARRNKDGSVVEYVQLAHNVRDADSGYAKPVILYNFGRRDRLDEEALRRLVHSINRFLGPRDELLGAVTARTGQEMQWIESRPMGSAWLLGGLWDKLDIGPTLVHLAKVRGVREPAGVGPMSKHATPDWLASSAFVPDVPDDLYDEQLYRAMDFLLSCSDEVHKAVFFATADLLNLEVDLLLYDTTSSYFEMEDDDEELIERQERWRAFDAQEGPEPTSPRPQVVNDPPLRQHGHSRDRRPDLAQVVVGMAVTREGIPVRCWVCPTSGWAQPTAWPFRSGPPGWSTRCWSTSPTPWLTVSAARSTLCRWRWSSVASTTTPVPSAAAIVATSSHTWPTRPSALPSSNVSDAHP